MSRGPRAAALLLGLTLAGCAFPEAREPAGEGSPSLAARGVTVRLPVDGGELVARARELTVDPGDGSLTMTGDASVTLEGSCPFEAGAERITIDAEGSEALLLGRVRARMVPAAPDHAKGAGGGGP